MMLRSLAGALTITLLAGSAWAASIPQPQTGTYEISNLVTTATGTACPWIKGDTFTSYFKYPGANTTGAKMWMVINEVAGSNYIEYIDFSNVKTPTKPVSGDSSTWGGSYTFTLLPGSATGSGSFTGIIENTDTFSFAGSMTMSFSDTLKAGSCNLDVQQVAYLVKGST
jgi:hypothetical protein